MNAVLMVLGIFAMIILACIAVVLIGACLGAFFEWLYKSGWPRFTTYVKTRRVEGWTFDYDKDEYGIWRGTLTKPNGDTLDLVHETKRKLVERAREVKLTELVRERSFAKSVKL